MEAHWLTVAISSLSCIWCLLSCIWCLLNCIWCLLSCIWCLLSCALCLDHCLSSSAMLLHQYCLMVGLIGSLRHMPEMVRCEA